MQIRKHKNDNNVRQHHEDERRKNTLQGKNIPTMQRKGLGLLDPVQFSFLDSNYPTQLKTQEEDEVNNIQMKEEEDPTKTCGNTVYLIFLKSKKN